MNYNSKVVMNISSPSTRLLLWKTSTRWSKGKTSKLLSSWEGECKITWFKSYPVINITTEISAAHTEPLAPIETLDDTRARRYVLKNLPREPH